MIYNFFKKSDIVAVCRIISIHDSFNRLIKKKKRYFGRIIILFNI